MLCKLKLSAAVRKPLLFPKCSLDLSSIVLRTLHLAHSTICILRDAILKTEGLCRGLLEGVGEQLISSHHGVRGVGRNGQKEKVYAYRVNRKIINL